MKNVIAIIVALVAWTERVGRVCRLLPRRIPVAVLVVDMHR
jgi:hypothetical protein